jgi:uncharacterized membrane protein
VTCEQKFSADVPWNRALSFQTYILRIMPRSEKELFHLFIWLQIKNKNRIIMAVMLGDITNALDLQ